MCAPQVLAASIRSLRIYAPLLSPSVDRLFWAPQSGPVDTLSAVANSWKLSKLQEYIPPEPVPLPSEQPGVSSLFPDSMADREFPLQSALVLAGGPTGSLSHLPTIRASFNTAAREAFALSLDAVDPRIRAKLDQPFGKDNLNQCFSAEPRLRHVLLRFKSVY